MSEPHPDIYFEVKTPPPPPPPPGLLQTKFPSAITFAVALLLFFLPFIDVKCNSMTIQKFTGLELATGAQINKSGDSMFGNMNTNTSTNTTNVEKKDPNVYAIGAMALAILGVLLSLLPAKAGGVGAMLTGILGAVCLILLFIDVKQQVKAEIPDVTGMGGELKISVDFSAAFYIALLLFVLAAIFGRKRLKAG